MELTQGEKGKHGLKEPQTTLLICEVSKFSDIFRATSARILLYFALVFIKHVPQNIVQSVREGGRKSLPAIVFDHVGKFNYKFSFFVLLTAFKSMFLDKKKYIHILKKY